MKFDSKGGILMEVLKWFVIFQFGVFIGVGLILFVQGSNSRNYTDDEEMY